ncbi:uncharacterized protein LY89DRAFT_663913 [Mollisia scopiformis]|uniref:Uncharacterized protein n=1 Tax=Mollisia scopiformis TaxID=149040 RepID=A0A194XTX2_MOLSC|nr:uncharacterized protein LY89DRAFT_663913 [Mollisia scopiformis]KUJ23484.1 hypothetical protein LY89DRAFT_663913 [Mollisia scopiformis]
MFFNISEGPMRTIFRGYFIVALALLGLIGDQCCKRAAKLQLARGKSVSLSRMTGWVRFMDIAKIVFKLRRLPGGPFLGSFMLGSVILALVADFSVTNLVLWTYVPSRCVFNPGIVLSTTQSSKWSAPPADEYPVLVASNAQITSYINGGMTGIYRKANNDSTFMSQPEDVLGSWNLGMLYSNGSTYDYIDSAGNTSSTLMIWSASVPDGAKGPFDVTIAFDRYASWIDGKTMIGCLCAVSSESESDLNDINEILSWIVANDTLWQWITWLPPAVYTGAGSNASDYSFYNLAQILNSLTMVEGGGDRAYDIPSDNATQGCYILQTWVSSFIFALVAITALALILMFAYLLLLTMRLGSRDDTNNDAPVSKLIPDGLLGWMLEAIRESALGEYPESAAAVSNEQFAINNWKFNTVNDSRGRYMKLSRTDIALVSHE